jgi:Protein of unknown function (DUF402)
MGDPARPGGASEPFLVEGRVVTVGARPYRVIKDSEDVSVLFQPEGTLLPRWLIAEQRYLDSPTATRGVTLRLLYTSKAYDVTLFFEGSGESPWYHDALFLREGLRAGWRVRRSAIAGISRGTPVNRNPGAFRGWYVNLQSTYRTPYGFDVVDQTLDIVVRPDRTWYWKDEDELALAVAKGACSGDYAATLRRAGEEAIKLVEERRSPFDDERTNWRPPSDWEILQIPDGWQSRPALIED